MKKSFNVSSLCSYARSDPLYLHHLSIPRIHLHIYMYVTLSTKLTQRL